MRGLFSGVLFAGKLFAGELFRVAEESVEAITSGGGKLSWYLAYEAKRQEYINSKPVIERVTEPVIEELISVKSVSKEVPRSFKAVRTIPPVSLGTIASILKETREEHEKAEEELVFLFMEFMN